MVQPCELIVLEKTGNEVTVIATEENYPVWMNELSKAFLKGKKISVRVAEKRELQRLIMKIHDFFGYIH